MRILVLTFMISCLNKGIIAAEGGGAISEPLNTAKILMQEIKKLPPREIVSLFSTLGPHNRRNFELRGAGEKTEAYVQLEKSDSPFYEKGRLQIEKNYAVVDQAIIRSIQSSLNVYVAYVVLHGDGRILKASHFEIYVSCNPEVSRLFQRSSQEPCFFAISDTIKLKSYGSRTNSIYQVSFDLDELGTKKVAKLKMHEKEKDAVRICSICKKPTDKTCARCRKARFCSVECQRKGWPTHKKTCKEYSKK